MATRRKQPDLPDEGDDPGDEQQQWGVRLPSGETAAVIPIDGDDGMEMPEERLARMLAAARPDNAQVRVYRVLSDKGAMGWCKNYSVQEFEDGGDLELIRREWGAGRYHMRVYNPKGRGVLSKIDVEIVAADKPVSLNPTAAVAPSGELAQVLQSMVETQRVILEKLASPTPDPMSQMMNMMGLMKLMREAMGPAAPPTPAAKSLVEQLTELRALQQVAGELAPKGEGSGDAEPSLLQLGSQVLGMVQAVQERQASTAPMLPVHVPASLAFPPIIATPAPAAVPSPPTPPQESHPAAPPILPTPPTLDEQAPMIDLSTLTPEQRAEIEPLQQLLAQVIDLAASGAPAETGAELLYEQLPDELLEQLWSEQWFAMLCHFEPRAKAYETWFREAHGLISAWAEDDETRSDSEDAEAIDAAAKAIENP